MVTAPSLASILSGKEGIRLVRRPFEPDDEIAFATSPPPAEDAVIVEGGEMRAMPVTDDGTSGFTHFLDGAQKSRLAFFDGQFPGYLAHLSAAVLRRVEGDMMEAEHPATLFAVFAPANAPRLDDIAAHHAVRRVSCEADEGMSAMTERVRNAISSERDRIERRVAADWIGAKHEGWLLADGGIMQLFPGVVTGAMPRVVGVVKSHRKQYFQNAAATEVVLALKTGERTCVFEATSTRQERDHAYSWYLRLREDEYESPSFGLIRVEMPPFAEALEWVDRVSSWLMAERAPLSLPDVRYDRMVYPIRRVEMYLRSLQPSEAALASIVGV